MKRLVIPGLALTMFVVFFAGRTMDEGMWLLDSINKLPIAEMKKHGLELTPEQIYSTTGTSVKDAIVILPGGTGTYVSADGLILTNHHIAFAGIQSLSSVQDDYLKDGFLAKTRDEELSTTYTTQRVVAMKDVTDEVLTGISDTMSVDGRVDAVRERSRQIEKDAKGTTDFTCTVSEMFNGVKYYLFTYERLNDVRLVYAPPGAIGNFGGEVDNWQWPRHTGDFAFMRAYVGPDGKAAKYSKENVPYTPKVFLPFSIKGYREGSLAMIMGFPGRTYRYREAASVELAHDETLPTSIDLFKTRMNIIENAGRKNRTLEIQYASKVRRIANTYKNYVGTLEGMSRSDLLHLKRTGETKFTEYINASPDLRAKYGTVLPGLESAATELKTFNRKNILFSNIFSLDILVLVNRFRSYVSSFPHDSLGAVMEPTEKERGPVRAAITSTFKDCDLHVEKETLIALILKSADFPVDQQSTTFREITGNRAGQDRERRAREFVEDLYEDTELATQAGCEKMLMEDAKAISKDAFMEFANKLNAEQAALQVKLAKFNQLVGQLRRKFLEAWLGWKHDDHLYPDANRTLRLTYGEVEPLHPRDAVNLSLETTLAGVLEKETGEDPFVVPGRLKELWKKKDFGRYSDPKVNDVPVAFISDLDITGGNSGSSILNGKGEIIGCAFDGNWEGVVGDYFFEDEYNRTISVDSRYILFVLDKFSGGDNIMKELVIH